jgi:hypothetical protein
MNLDLHFRCGDKDGSEMGECLSLAGNTCNRGDRGIGGAGAEMSWKNKDRLVSLRSVAFAEYMAVSRTNTKNKLGSPFGIKFCAMGGL